MRISMHDSQCRHPGRAQGLGLNEPIVDRVQDMLLTSQLEHELRFVSDVDGNLA